MAIANVSGILAAQSRFTAAYSAMFGAGPGGVAPLFTMDVPTDGLATSIPVITSFPRFREWVGSKQVADVRALMQTVLLKTYEKTVGFSRKEVVYDPSGAVGAGIDNWVANAAQAGFDDIAIASLIANTQLGYDGVSLLNASHPFSFSTGNNITTTALSFESYRAARAAMALFADELGTPLGVTPKTLLVGPQLERIAKEIAGPLRPTNVSSAGLYDQAASVVGMATLENVFQGDITVIVSSWITGTQWFLMDTTKAGLRPYIRTVAREFEPIFIDGAEMSASDRFFKDKYYFSIEGDSSFAPGLWQLIYGKVTP